MSGLSGRANGGVFLMKKIKGTATIERAGKIMICKEGSHHPLYLSLEKLTWAELLDNDPVDYIVRIKSEIRCLAEDHEDGPVVGQIHAQLIEVDRALRMGQPLYDVFDSYGETWSFFEALTSRYTKFHTSLRHYLGEGAPSRNVLLLTLIEIEPPHRSKKLGLQATASLMEQLRNFCGLVMCNPFPVQFGPIGEDPQWQFRFGAGLQGDEATATAKLKNYWRQLGFKEIGKTGFLVLAMESFDPTGIFDDSEEHE
jgi:hypothetical protein